MADQAASCGRDAELALQERCKREEAAGQRGNQRQEPWLGVWTTHPVSSPAHGHPVSHPPLPALRPWRPLGCPPLWFQQRQNTPTSRPGQGGAREHRGRAGMWEQPGAQGGRPLPSLSSLPGHKLAASPLERVPAPGPGLAATAAARAPPPHSPPSPAGLWSQSPCPGQLPVASPWRGWGGWELVSRRPQPSGRAARGYSGAALAPALPRNGLPRCSEPLPLPPRSLVSRCWVPPGGHSRGWDGPEG